MKARNAENGFKNLLVTCADLKAEESVLIVSDESTENMGLQLSELAKNICSQVKHRVISRAPMHGKEPPPDIAILMKQSDVIFGMTKMSMAHTIARYEATEQGARYLSLPDYSFELLNRPALYVNFREITPLANHLAALLTEANHIRITSSLGSDLTLNIKGRKGNSAPGWCFAKGTLSSPPDAEANVPPVETESEGVLIVDGSIPCKEIGLLKDPISLHLKSGKIVDIQGKQADILNEVFDQLKNVSTRVAAEFGIGLNPAAELIGSMLEDEGCLGTIHIGFGSNATIGGKNSVPFHLDTIMRYANIYIDSQPIMENGQLVINF